MSAAAPMFIKLTRRGYLATILMQAYPESQWGDIDERVERIASRGETQSKGELELMVLANITEFPEKKFPDGGRSS